MSGNRLRNAGFLDGITNWNAPAGVLSVDETTLGAPGRAVLQVTGTGGSGALEGVFCDTVPATPGEVLDVFGGYAASAGPWLLDLQWMLGTNGVSTTPIPQARPPLGVARRGLPRTFSYGFGRVTTPDGVNGVRIRATTVLPASGAFTVGLLKPYIGAASGNAWPTTWDPGTHVNPDLQLPCWPSTLRPFQNSSNPAPTPNAKAFATDSGIPVREDLYTGLHYDLKGQVRVTPEELEDLEYFYETARNQFFVVDPFTDRLCIAEWLADGAPTFASDDGPTATYGFGLHMTVA